MHPFVYQQDPFREHEHNRVDCAANQSREAADYWKVCDSAKTIRAKNVGSITPHFLVNPGKA